MGIGHSNESSKQDIEISEYIKHCNERLDNIDND